MAIPTPAQMEVGKLAIDPTFSDGLGNRVGPRLYTLTTNNQVAGFYADGVQISGVTGNRAQMLSDGLAVIDTAPANVAVQYISPSLGSDTNDGTRNFPLASIQEALARIAAGAGFGTYNLVLRCGETHVCNTALAATQNAFIRLSGYDDPIYGDLGFNNPYPGYYVAAASNFTRPIVDFQVFTNGAYTQTPVIYCNGLQLDGLDIRLVNQLSTYPGDPHFCFLASQSTGSFGCNVTTRSNFSYLLRTPQFVFENAVITLAPSTSFGEVRTSFFTSQDNSYATTFSAPGQPTFTGRMSNARATLTPANIQTGGAYDATTKSQFGWGTSWDIFAP